MGVPVRVSSGRENVRRGGASSTLKYMALRATTVPPPPPPLHLLHPTIHTPEIPVTVLPTLSKQNVLSEFLKSQLGMGSTAHPYL